MNQPSAQTKTKLFAAAIVTAIAACSVHRRETSAPTVAPIVVAIDSHDAGGAHTVPNAPLVLGTPLELDAVWQMQDWPATACGDGHGYWHVDLKSKAFSFSVCDRKTIVVARTLEDKELAAIVELVTRLPRGSAVRVVPDCPRLQWRGSEGEYNSDAQLCPRPAEPLSPKQRDDDWAVQDTMNLLRGWRVAHERDAKGRHRVCGGPLDQKCTRPSVCESRDGLLPYAFGSCSVPSSGGRGQITISCLTIAYCPPGWKDSVLSEKECATKGRTCRYVSSGCSDETLCEKCAASETCPGGPPPVE